MFKRATKTLWNVIEKNFLQQRLGTRYFWARDLPAASLRSRELQVYNATPGLQKKKSGGTFQYVWILIPRTWFWKILTHISCKKKKKPPSCGTVDLLNKGTLWMLNHLSYTPGPIFWSYNGKHKLQM